MDNNEIKEVTLTFTFKVEDEDMMSSNISFDKLDELQARMESGSLTDGEKALMLMAGHVAEGYHKMTSGIQKLESEYLNRDSNVISFH